MNKTIYVKSFFKPIGENVKIKVPTGEKKKKLFGGEKDVTEEKIEWRQTGFSDSEIDGERLALDINKAIIFLNSEEYEVTSILNINSGRHNYDWGKYGTSTNGSAPTCYSYGYGYSYTEGVVIIARKASIK